METQRILAQVLLVLLGPLCQSILLSSFRVTCLLETSASKDASIPCFTYEIPQFVVYVQLKAKQMTIYCTYFLAPFSCKIGFLDMLHVVSNPIQLQETVIKCLGLREINKKHSRMHPVKPVHIKPDIKIV